MQKPSIGRQVHYVLANGQHRAATVVNTPGGERLNLTVHLDGMNDCAAYRRDPGEDAPHPGSGECARGLIPPGAAILGPGLLTVGSAAPDEETKLPGTWHWPEFVQ